MGASLGPIKTLRLPPRCRCPHSKRMSATGRAATLKIDAAAAQVTAPVEVVTPPWLSLAVVSGKTSVLVSRRINAPGERLIRTGVCSAKRVTTHAGPFVTLPAAYAAIFPRVTQLPKHQLIGLPAVEIYQTARVNARLQLNVTDICLPVVGSR